jgi:hypothetical protein
MTLKEIGGTYQTVTADDELLTANWYEQLTDVQLTAYVRYQFIRLKERVIDWNTPAHSRPRPNWDGGEDGYGMTFKSMWPKIVGAIRKYNACPGVWVAARFSGVAVSFYSAKKMAAPPIKPSTLWDHNVTTIYAEYVKRFPDTFQFNLNVAANVVSSRLREMSVYPISDDARLFYVLCDEEHLSADPIFRYGLANVGRCKKAALRYLWPATVDYEAQQFLYDDAMGQHKAQAFISDEMRNNIINIRKHWVTYNG